MSGSLYVYSLLLLALGLQCFPSQAFLSRHERTNRHASPSTRLLQSRPFYSDFGMEEEEIRPDSQRPTAELPEHINPIIGNPRPKIVVLGATGRIGRRVIRQLLEMESLDATIVAFVRNYDKACRVFFDDVLVAHSQKKGPKLQIVMGNLVSRRDLPPAVQRKLLSEEEDDWRERAKSASLFFRNSIQNYNDGEHLDTDEEALDEAIRDSTAIISCVGGYRVTNIWTDVVARPLMRLVRWDVRNWCLDMRHPYYVHYHSTLKAIRIAETEQRRRESNTENDEEWGQVPRIRFVRVSDLSVSCPPWQLVPLVLNTLCSMVFRYHELSERLLEQSTLLDTITLRPGDVVDDERDLETTNIQLTTNGKVPFPARIGRDDVAALAVEGAILGQPKRQQQREDQPFHYCMACRWVSDQLSPHPPQGQMSDGLPSAHLCMRNALRKLAKQRRPKCVARRKMKPYGIWVAVPLYLVLSLTLCTLAQDLAAFLPTMPAPLRKSAERFVSFVGTSRWWRRILRLTPGRTASSYFF